MRRLPSLLVLLIAVAVAVACPLLGAPATALAATTVQTQAPTSVAATQAALNATVNPSGVPTTVHFELGTSTAYGLQSASKDAGSGSSDVAVQIPVQGLTSDTTYHVRAVATGPGGMVTATGTDVTFRTAKAPAAPYVTGTTAREVTLSGATLVGSVTPRGADTTYHFEYGRTTSYGTSTPATAIGAGWSAVPASARLDGLEPGKSYHFRLVATNANGTTRSSDHRLVVASTPTAASLAAEKYLIPYGSAVKLTGRLAGSKIAGVRVRLQLTSFPFSAPFADVATATSTSKGNYTFTVPNVDATFRAVVIAPGLPDVLSPVITVRVGVITGLASVRATRTRLTVRGSVTPATPKGTVSLQRSTRTGRWVFVARRRVAADGSYVIRAARSRRGRYYRVVGVPHDGGGHASSASRTVWVAARPKAKRHHR